MRILAIDPGTKRSAWVLYDPNERSIVDCGILDNEAVLDEIEFRRREQVVVVIEKVESYGMAVGAEVFETVFWSGRFAQAAERRVPVIRLPRRAVKLHLCGSARAKDANIRAALIDKFGGKEEAIGSKASPGPLYGVKADLWAALAVAVTQAEAA